MAKKPDHFKHVCHHMQELIQLLESHGHEYVTSRLDRSEIHFAPELKLRLTGELSEADVSLITNDCSGQLKFDLKKQWLGCWCATVRFKGKKQP